MVYNWIVARLNDEGQPDEGYSMEFIEDKDIAEARMKTLATFGAGARYAMYSLCKTLKFKQVLIEDED